MSSSCNSPARGGHLLYLWQGSGRLQSHRPPPSCLAVPTKLTVVNYNHLVIASCHCYRAAAASGTRGGGRTGGGGAEILHSLDIEAEVVSVVSGAGLVLQLPGLAIRQPQVHCKNRKSEIQSELTGLTLSASEFAT